jgi:hypothetical protein
MLNAEQLTRLANLGFTGQGAAIVDAAWFSGAYTSSAHQIGIVLICNPAGTYKSYIGAIEQFTTEKIGAWYIAESGAKVPVQILEYKQQMNDIKIKGNCCICNIHNNTVRNIVLLERKNTINPGKGWGCVICDLPEDGAVAILCDPCAKKLMNHAKSVGYDDDSLIKYACAEYPVEPERIPLSQLIEPYKHLVDHD